VKDSTLVSLRCDKAHETGTLNLRCHHMNPGVSIMKKSLLALALAAGLPAAMAADQTVTFQGNATEGYVAEFDDLGPLFDGGDKTDVISFAGLAAGTYDFTLSFSGQFVQLNSATLNGVTVPFTKLGNLFFGGLEATGASPFVLTLKANGFNAKRGSYEGTLTATPVPEPETYALMLAGLGAIGFLLRRRGGR
jgi:hypothetical protein